MPPSQWQLIRVETQHSMMLSHKDSTLKVADLVGSPGMSRQVDRRFDVPAGLDLPLVEAVDRLRLHGVVESVVEGVLVRGVVATTLVVSCARCLVETRRDVRADVAELFSDPVRHLREVGEELEPGYGIHEGEIDLEHLLRDALVPAVPFKPLCRADCAGLCATCGTNRNEAACSCTDDETDPRWAVLEGLTLPEQS
jgi:uncharacterized protein